MRQYGMVAALSSRGFGQMRWSGTQPAAEVAHNRQLFMQALGFDAAQLISPALVHGTELLRVYDADAGRGALEPAGAIPNIDGLLTRSGRALPSVTVADCLPIFFFDHFAGAFAVVHAGWRGIAAGIVERTLGLFDRLWSSDAEHMHVSIGPSIRSCHFTVKPDVAAVFQALEPSAVTRQNDLVQVDLQTVVKSSLRAHGIASAHIEDAELCTVCQADQFFSARSQAPWDGQAGLAVFGRKDVGLMNICD